jgi:protein-S-isoprenylcysteine O-methyltransferase Ste14
VRVHRTLAGLQDGGKRGSLIGRGLLLFCAGLCLGSFAWGMVRHFRRLGKPSRTMLLTALLGVACATLQIDALDTRQLRFPEAALALYSASVALFWWAVLVTRGKLAACGQGCVSPEVVRAGPYRYIRHPFYASYNMTWLAGFAAVGWWPLAIGSIVMAALYERFAQEEEWGVSISPLAGEYREYKRRTGRYLPRIGVQ